MKNTDPNRLAVELPKNFVAKLREGRDKAGIVKFATTSETVLGLTPVEQSPDIIANLDGIAYNGLWTNGANGLHDALELTDKSSAEFKYIIFLTDGNDTVSSPYSYSDLIDRASQNGVIVYTIGTGTANASTLKRIASGTGGAYYAATSTGTGDMLDLEEVYKKIEKEAEAMRTDSNNNGISDYYTDMLNDGRLTVDGIALFAGLINNISDDWDNDGLKNNEEIIVSVDAYGTPYVHMMSNPTLIDTDLDGYSDYQEVMEMGTSPLKYTMLPSDFDLLRKDSIYPIEYRNYSLPGNDNFFVNLMENFVKVFAGDQQKSSREAFIDYFYKYSTTTEILSRDAEVADKMIQNQNIIDGIHLTSSFIKMIKDVIDFCDDVGDEKFTASGQAKERAKTMRDEADKTMAKMLDIKKKDVDRLNQMWFEKAKNNIPYARQKAEVSALRYEFSNIQSSVNSLSKLMKDFEKAENGSQWWTQAFNHASGAFAFFSTGVQTLAAFNKIELPCKWDFLKKLHDIRGSKGGKIFSGTITVGLTAANTVAECLSVSNTYGKIAANYAEYQKYLDLLRHIENNASFPDYVRNGAREIAEMFDAGGEPDWDKFDSKVKAAINKQINAGVFQAIIDVTGIFFPVVKQVNFVYNAAKTSIELTGVALQARTMIEAEIYYSIADGSRTLFNKGVTMVAGYFESIKETTDSGEAGKYAVQLAQARIVGLDSVRSLVQSGKLVEWVGRLIAQAFTGRTDEVIKREYETAIQTVYDVAEKCGMNLSDKLPR
ncbi:MAG: VWA domain-containing protein [Synergistaceae bacterium]|nr:VWA domain-containing protein [Synergistaceae bacterium]